MDGAITAALVLVTKVLELVGTKEATKYRDRSVDLKLEIQRESAKGFDSDDAKLEALYQESRIIIEAANQEFIRYVATRPSN